MNKQIVTGVTLLVLAITAAPAMARDHGKGRFMKFFDTNGDGSVNMVEFKAATETRFNSMDKDGSGIVSMDEFKEYMRGRRQERKQKRFGRMDSNNNGTVERDEYLAYKQARAERKFTRMDKDGDGVVSQQEYEQCQKRKQHKHGLFKRMDENGDGQVSRNETLSAWSKWFKRIDANNDEVVTADEVRAYRERLHGTSGKAE